MTVVDLTPPRPSLLSRLTAGKVALVLGVLLAAGGATAGTWASFTASTTNGATFATGTLLLSDKVSSNTACFSTATGSDITTNDRTDCDALFDGLVVHKPGDSTTTTVAIANEGTLSGDLTAYIAGCTAGDSAGTAFHGNGNPCSQLQFTIQEYADSGRTTPSNCLVGSATGVGVTCAFGPTLADFVASNGSFGSALAVGAMTPAQTRWFTVGLQLPLSAGNTFQGRSATFGLTWRMAQQ
jgi:hypothetical protein